MTDVYFEKDEKMFFGGNSKLVEDYMKEAGKVGAAILQGFA